MLISELAELSLFFFCKVNFLIYVLLKQMLKFACLSGGGTVSTVMQEGVAMSIILNLAFS